MIKAVIVDDEPIIRTDIGRMLAAYPDISVVGSCGSVKEAVQLIPELAPQLLLLDVRLSDGFSFDILKALPDLECAIIFITAFDTHAIRAIRIGALDYLLKPLNEEELRDAIGKARKHPSVITGEQVQVAARQLDGGQLSPSSIVLRSQKNVQIVAVDQIIYCEGAGNYTVFHLDNGQSVTVSRALKDYEELLPRAQFIRSHQSYLVNINFIRTYDRDGFLHLHNRQEIPVSFRKKEAVLAAIMARK